MGTSVDTLQEESSYKVIVGKDGGVGEREKGREGEGEKGRMGERMLK
jgi:hypothetical protein